MYTRTLLLFLCALVIEIENGAALQRLVQALPRSNILVVCVHAAKQSISHGEGLRFQKRNNFALLIASEWYRQRFYRGMLMWSQKPEFLFTVVGEVRSKRRFCPSKASRPAGQGFCRGESKALRDFERWHEPFRAGLGQQQRVPVREVHREG
jgi:hypothetical protein